VPTDFEFGLSPLIFPRREDDSPWDGKRLRFCEYARCAALTTFPPYRPERAKQLMSLMGGTYASRGMTSLDEGLYPKDSEHVYAGAYDQALVVGSTVAADSAFDGGVPLGCGSRGQVAPRRRAS
jgi:hypothetical protein